MPLQTSFTDNKTLKAHIMPWDWLLILGLMLAPMTGLRVWKIGPAEVLVFLWCLRFFPRQIIPNGDLLRFFLEFLGCMAIGTVIGLYRVPEEVVLSGWPTWLYLMFVSLGMYQGLRGNSLAYNEKLLTRFATLAVLWQLLLYILANAGLRSILGAPLWYYYRYSGGGTNPHQVAVMMCGLVFIFAREAFAGRHVLWNVLLAAAGVMILLATESSTGVLALVFGAMIGLMVFFNRGTSPQRRLVLIVIELLLGAAILLVLYRVIYRFAYDWVANDTNGLGRLAIFSQISRSFRLSPFFGLGPGMHSRANGGLIEYHNTYLEVLAASGLLGFIAFGLFTIRLLDKARVDISFLPVITAMYAYGIAGFAMRRLVYWGIIVSILVLSEQIIRAEHISAQNAENYRESFQ